MTSERLPLSEPPRVFLASLAAPDFPGLVSFWDFSTRTATGTWPSSAGERYEFRERGGEMSRVADADAPFGASALRIDTGQWLDIPRAQGPRLDFRGDHGRFTLVAWIRRHEKQSVSWECEFIAGMWNETANARQYGLFLNIPIWGEPHRLCGHLSRVGGPTPGYIYAADGPVGASAIPYESWTCVAMSYDGHVGYAWLDGKLDARPGLNPYLMPGGLYEGGATGSDFTVGAVDRLGEIGNQFVGLLGGLAIYDRVLTPAEMWALALGTTDSGVS